MTELLTARAEVAATRVHETLYEISADARGDMRVPARIYADAELWDQIAGDRSLEQLMNVAALPGVTRAVYAMPDAHEGYGFPVGGVAAFRTSDGIISPGGVGYDINCGVRLLLTDLDARDLGKRLEPLVHELSRSIPSGTGRGGKLQLSDDELDRVFVEGCAYLVERGMATQEDLLHTESGARLPGADPRRVSKRARDRGRSQLGSMGAGNHFVEVERVSDLFDPDAAQALGLEADRVAVLIHTGSRGLGHQVCTDYVAKMDRAMSEAGITLPDRQLACAPFASPAGQAYFGAMCAAANYAWCNREVISWEARTAWKNTFGKRAGNLKLLYDVAHNIAKIETYTINGADSKVIVHRKGATRAFGPAFEELPPQYFNVGQPVIIPGSMGTCSYVLAGAAGSKKLTFGSCCHGAGRQMSRTAAKKRVNAPVLKQELREKGIYVEAGSFKGL
jgi:tRNA-splicing ligase RtcB